MCLNFQISYRDIYLATWFSWWPVDQIWLMEMFFFVVQFFPLWETPAALLWYVLLKQVHPFVLGHHPCPGYAHEEEVNFSCAFLCVEQSQSR